MFFKICGIIQLKRITSSVCKLHLNESKVKKQAHMYITGLKFNVPQLSVLKLSFHYQDIIGNNKRNDYVDNLAFVCYFVH